MGKFTTLAIQNVGSGELSAEQSAALAAADAITARSGPVAVTPTEAKASRVPQATPTGSPEGIQEIQEAGLVAQAPELEEGVRPLSPEESTQTYQGQLAAEQQTPFLDVEEGTLSLPTAGMASKGASVAQIAEDVARTEHAFDAEEGFIAPVQEGKGASYASALDKLGLAEPGKRKGTLKARKGAGGAAYLATLVALARLKGEAAADIKAEENLEGATAEQALAGRESNFNRISLANAISGEFEQMVRPSPTVDQVTGEATGAGYASDLSPAEKSALGDSILVAMEQGGLIGESLDNNHAYLQKIKVGTGAGRAYEYALTQAGYQHLNNLSPMLEKIGPGMSRPVSAVPTRKGIYRGELATRQKDLTYTPEEGVSEITPLMEEAMDVMGSMGNIISEHKLRQVNQMLDDVTAKLQEGRQAIDQAFQQRTDMTVSEAFNNKAWDKVALLKEIEAEIWPQVESPFAKLFDVDYATRVKNIKASEAGSRKAVKAVYEGDGVWVFERTGRQIEGESLAALNERYPSAEIGTKGETRMTFSKREDGTSHYKFAQDVARMSLDKARKTLRDAQAQQGKVFYYGATAIGNSSRLMYSQTDLNPQANKLARFLVDNPRPTIVEKGGKNDRAFKYVVARAMMDKADTVTPKELLRRFEDPQFQESIAPAAKALAAGDLATGVRLAQQNKSLADEWKGTGEWGFVLDALHEWGRYLNADKQIATRVKAEADGINNGSSIQGLQFGSKDILKRAGVIYDPNDPEGSVIPEGNMREYVWTTLMSKDMETGERVAVGDLKKEDEREYAGALLEMVESQGLIKDFIKIPLMTTIYGKPYAMHGDHAKAFIIDNMEALGIDIDDVPKATRVVTKAISNGLQTSLTDALLHQDVIKHTAGWFFNMANEIPQVKGANDFIIQSGGHDYIDNPELNAKSTVITKYYPEGKERTKAQQKQSEIVSKIKVPSATASKAPLHKSQEPSIGNITRNQLAVSGTHNIDATIAQKTLVRAFKEIPNFWGMQVFDAFLGDVSSFEKLVDIGNQEFAAVNQEYNMVEAEYDAFKESMKKLQQKANEAQKEGEVWDVSPSGTYNGIYAFAKRFINKPGHWKDGSHGAFINLLSKYGFETNEKGALENSPQFLTPMQVLDIIKFSEKNFLSPKRAGDKGLPVHEAFRAQLADVERQRKSFMETYGDLIKFIRQYN